MWRRIAPGPPPVAFAASEAAPRRPRRAAGWVKAELLCGGLERGLAQATDLAVALQHETAAMERGERRAVADRYDRGAPESRVEKAVKRGFGRLIERSRRLVEEEIIRRLEDGAGNA